MLHLQRKAEIQILSSTRPSTESPQQESSSSSSRLVDYVKKALWLALEDEEGEEDEDEALSMSPKDEA